MVSRVVRQWLTGVAVMVVAVTYLAVELKSPRGGGSGGGGGGVRWRDQPGGDDNLHFIHNYPSEKEMVHLVCAVESAARQLTRPRLGKTKRRSRREMIGESSRKIIIHASHVTALKVRLDSVLSETPASRVVEVTPLDVRDTFLHSPLSDWFLNGSFRETTPKQWLGHNIADGLRLALLWRHGGTYLDMDTVTVRPDIWRWSPGEAAIVRQRPPNSAHLFANGFLHAPRGHPFLRELMTRFVREYTGGVWGHQGPGLVTRVVKDLCGDHHVFNCSAVTVLPAVRMFEVGWDDHSFVRPFKGERSHLTNIRNKSWAVHYWDGQLSSRRGQLCFPHGSLLHAVFINYCPLTMDRYGERLACD